ncbi:MAG: hypothetical protein ACJ79K_10300 [Gemmatimonadaceae bacterium]
MPITFEIDGTIVVLHLTGIYPPSELRAAFVAALAKPRERPLSGIMVDLRESESLMTRTLGDMTSIVGFLAYHATAYGNRVALVVAGDTQYAVIRMAAEDLHTAGIAASVFRDAGEALRWLRPSTPRSASFDASASR